MKKIVPLLAILMMAATACAGFSDDSDVTLAPDFNLPNSIGEDVSLRDYEGRNVLLFFHMAVG